MSGFLLALFISLKVRQLGKILDVPEGFLKRHPFPGPGLAVRVLGDVMKDDALDILRQVCVVKACHKCFSTFCTLKA